MGPVVVIVTNEALYTSFQFSWQIVVLKQDLVFQRTAPALDLTLGLRMKGLLSCASYPAPQDNSPGPTRCRQGHCQTTAAGLCLTFIVLSPVKLRASSSRWSWAKACSLPTHRSRLRQSDSARRRTWIVEYPTFAASSSQANWTALRIG
mgnify:CR=1 FL=1